MFEESCKRYSIAFEQQFNYACIYAYIKIKEQEIKNIILIAEITGIGNNNDTKLKQSYIVPFNY